jgi:NodT family efflux transporter outer membrane factor (OMF) lipoprotein
MPAPKPEAPRPRPTWPRALWTATALALGLGGCASGAPEASALPEVAVPTDWASAAARPGGAPHPLARWWESFNDPQLVTLVSQALEVNTSVRSAQSALQQARALRDVSSANRYPRVNASGSAQRSQSGSNDAVDTFQAGFDASWELDVFGAKRSAQQAGEADASAAESTLADVQVSIAAEVAVSYIELRGLQARLAIARTNLGNQNETQQITAWRTQSGLASSLDLEQATAASAQTSAAIPALEAQAATAQHRLAVLTGQAPGALQAALSVPGPLPQTSGEFALAIPAQTLRQRPDVRAAEHRVSAALARVSQADAARYPSFQLSGTLGLSAGTPGALVSSATVANSVLARISVPLFDAGAAQAQVRAQEAALEQVRVSYQATVLTALQEVEDALVALQGNRERLAHLQVAADAAGNADLLARQRYASGLIDFRSVLETQRTLLSTQDSVESTRASLSADHVRLYKALGGGWPAATP